LIAVRSSRDASRAQRSLFPLAPDKMINKALNPLNFHRYGTSATIDKVRAFDFPASIARKLNRPPNCIGNDFQKEVTQPASAPEGGLNSGGDKSVG
jgi:hypothetical protein